MEEKTLKKIKASFFCLFFFITCVAYSQHPEKEKKDLDKNFGGAGQKAADRNKNEAPFPVKRGENDEVRLQIALVAEYLKAVQSLAVLKEQAIFLQTKKIQFQFAQEELPDMGWAAFRGDRIDIQKTAWIQMVNELIGRGVPREEVPKIVALKTLPVIAHEIKHGMSQNELAVQYGLHSQVGFLEDEIVAHFEEVLVYRDLRVSHPQLWSNPAYFITAIDQHRKSWWRLWEGDLAELYRYVQQHYKVPSVLRSDRADLLETYTLIQKFLQGQKDLVENLEKDAASTSNPNKRREIEALQKQFPFDREMARLLKSTASFVEILKDPQKFENFRRYYKEQLDLIAQQYHR